MGKRPPFFNIDKNAYNCYNNFHKGIDEEGFFFEGRSESRRLVRVCKREGQKLMASEPEVRGLKIVRASREGRVKAFEGQSFSAT